MMLMEFLILLVFVMIFFSLIKLKSTFYQGRDVLAKILLGINLILLAILCLSAGFGPLLLFFLCWVGIALGSYGVYRKLHPKSGIIGACFCLFFSAVFVYLQLYLFNFNF